MKKTIFRIQKELSDLGFDGWLFYDYENRDRFISEIFCLDPESKPTRPWFYFIPKSGSPVIITYKIDEKTINLFGKNMSFTSKLDLNNIFSSLVSDKTIAMQYSENGNIPWISVVDAGTFEFVKSFNSKIVSSKDLLQKIIGSLNDEGFKSHLSSQKKLHLIKDETFNFIKNKISKKEVVSELSVQKFILDKFEELGLTSDGDKPIVAVSEHSSIPHYFPSGKSDKVIKVGDFVQIDLWAREKAEKSIYSDISWVASVGLPSDKVKEIFSIVKQARDETVLFISKRLKENKVVKGFEADLVCREFISKKGFGEFFIHGTGHSIDSKVHGFGVNLSNNPYTDDRIFSKGVLFSVEPGVYLPNLFGIRTEIDVFVSDDLDVKITGPVQDEIIIL